MNIEWVNHASFVLETNGIRLICDPWLDGAIFNNGWKLLSPTKFAYESFADITHIFISHQHPDHFSPPNLKKIPKEMRAGITVLFQETSDRSVIRFCKALGFTIQELPKHRWVQVHEGVTVMNGPQGLLDSWLVLKAEGKTILNFNDCVFNTPQLLRLRNLIQDVDVLLTQFSYANWVGNPDDDESAKAAARRKLGDLRRQIEAFAPKFLIPCASFVWFSHRENYHLNTHMNRVRDVHKFATEDLEVETVVMYPGDLWKVGKKVDSEPAMAQYDRDYAVVAEARKLGILGRSKSVPLESLRDAQCAYFRKAFPRNSRLMLYAIPPSVVHISDLDVNVQLSFHSELRVLKGQSVQPDVVLSSDSLRYCFLHDWGGNALEVNGRYEAPRGGSAKRFFRLFKVALWNSAGERVSPHLAIRQAINRFSGRRFRGY